MDIHQLSLSQAAKAIDHALLHPAMGEAETLQGCELARAYGVASVCVKPCYVHAAGEVLAESSVHVGTVIGFPHGAHATQIKVKEAQRALIEGAVELDMVMNIGFLKDGAADEVRNDLQAVCETAHINGAVVKVILETAYLTDDQKRLACRLAEEAGADWVKTSTGFAPSGHTLADLALMREATTNAVQIKAAGGVRTLEDFLAVLEVGCTRVGATATRNILEDFKAWKAGTYRLKADGDLPSGY